MKVELLEPYIQISIEKESQFLKRAINFAYKHFSKAYRLSSSVLILDDGERYKKDYFLNWAYHVAMQESDKNKSDDFNTIIDNSYLPIRIKMVENQAILEFVEISLQMVHTSFEHAQVCLKLDRPNRLARRYLTSKFREFVLSYTKQEVFLDSSKPIFWEKLIEALSQKIVHNVVLDFDYETFKTYNTFECFENYLTKEEKALKKSYKILGCGYNDDFEQVKSRYIELAKIYHPDNVYGQDKKIIEGYAEKFRIIKEAYENIKTNFKRVA
ncbi:J domain-containing protein [Helicobacter burdigaliensis]|uniref:J domain-containing protein n=1 Tax=Helicobacter burdigaliensis TaxID=2315334 RepID=UPI000EF6D010|nr:J domain-containing protein [Helicobacter burdigaliensis]